MNQIFLTIVLLTCVAASAAAEPAATVIDQTVNRVYSSFWEHYPARRSLMFLFDSQHVPGSVIFSSFAVGTLPQVAATP